MLYCAIDIETTSLNPEDGQILEMAAIIDDLDRELYPSPPTYHSYFHHHQIYGEPAALVMNAHLIKIIAEGYGQLP